MTVKCEIYVKCEKNKTGRRKQVINYNKYINYNKTIQKLWLLLLYGINKLTINSNSNQSHIIISVTFMPLCGMENRAVL